MRRPPRQNVAVDTMPPFRRPSGFRAM